MNRSFIFGFILSFGLSISPVAALANVDARVAALDKLGTCQTTIQHAYAVSALKWIDAFEAWDLKTQLDLFATDFVMWHSSFAGLASATLGTPTHATLPFPNGQVTKSNYVSTLAFLAFANDHTKHKVVPKRLDCVGEDTVALDLQFDGFQVKRDTDGYITYGVDYSAPTTKLFVFNAAGKITNQHVVLDGRTSVEARAKLTALLQQAAADPAQFPPLPRVEESRGLAADFVKKFEAQLK